MMNRQYYLYRFELIYWLLNFRWWKYKSVDEAGIILENRLCKAAETSSNVAETNNFEDAERKTNRKKWMGMPKVSWRHEEQKMEKKYFNQKQTASGKIYIKKKTVAETMIKAQDTNWRSSN